MHICKIYSILDVAPLHIDNILEAGAYLKHPIDVIEYLHSYSITVSKAGAYRYHPIEAILEVGKYSIVQFGGRGDKGHFVLEDVLTRSIQFHRTLMST